MTNPLKTEPAIIVTFVVGVLQTVTAAQSEAGVETGDYVSIAILAVAAIVIRSLVFAAQSVDEIVGYIIKLAKDKTGVDLSEDV